MRLSAICRLLLMAGAGLVATLRGAGSDPFSSTRNGYDEWKPTLETYAKSLPAAEFPAGREVWVELAERDIPERMTALIPSLEAPAGLTLDADTDLPAIRVKLNTAGWVERREWIRRDPAGKVLDEPIWTGSVLCVRPEETKADGEWRLQILYSVSQLEGWVQDKGVYQPILARRAINTHVTLFPNRWLMLGSGGVDRANQGTDGESARGRATLLWLRVADNATRAADVNPAPLVADPTTITPAR